MRARKPMFRKRAFRHSQLCNTVVVACDGVEALEKMRSMRAVRKPYLVLLDINMPRMNGIEFLGEIRKDEDLRDAVVFVFTTSNAPEDRARYAKL